MKTRTSKKSRQSTSQEIGERTIDLFRLKNVPVYQKSAPPLLQTPPYVVAQAPYKTCYDVNGKIDAKVYLPRNRVINIECKYQHGSGTTDEKFPYVFRCFALAVDCTEFILLYDGNHWEESKKGIAAVKWAKKEADSFRHGFHKPVHVLNWSGFIAWLESEFA